jgi:hypothetical protein
MTGLLGSRFPELGHDVLVFFTRLDHYSEKIERPIVVYFRWIILDDLRIRTAH